tara:strand:+ start:1189 stop:1902 length:714 start_codon:yes stop_codon:yes gene_type:complete
MTYSQKWLNKFKKKNNLQDKIIVFDVGSADGEEFLNLCRNNKNLEVFAFEPLPKQFEIIKKKTNGLMNFNIYNLAVSNYEGKSKFNTCSDINFRTSSLKKYDINVDDTWKYCWNGRFKDSKISDEWKFIKQIEVDVIRLDKFINENNIQLIHYLHCDTQGNDFEVIKDLIKQKKIIEGVIECNTFDDRPLYENQKSVNFVEKFLKENNYCTIKKNEQATDKNLKRGLETNLFFKLIN